MKAMSFTAQVKEQLCSLPLTRPCDVMAEAYGLLMFATVFSRQEIRHMTQQESLVLRIQQLMEKAFGLTVQPRQAEENPHAKSVFVIDRPDQIRKILTAYGLDAAHSNVLRLNRVFLEEECCLCAFLRGAFLAGGSVADPQRRYHLELVTPHYNLSRQIVSLLLDIHLEPKVTLRKANYVIYFKYSERIEDFLTRIGAPLYAMQVMTAKVEKELRNQVNRQVNCEAANISKTVTAAGAQLAAIRALESAGRLDTLPPELKEAARARLARPEDSLSALAQGFDPPLRRATLNYRLQKLIALAGERPGSNGETDEEK